LESNKQLLKLTIQRYGENHAEVAVSHNLIGETYIELSDYKKGLQNFEFVLKIQEKLYECENNADIATSMNNLGAAYKNLGDYKKAFQLQII